jgi:hypothetical protein
MFKNRISAETCLPIRFLETPTYHSILEFSDPNLTPKADYSTLAEVFVFLFFFLSTE